MSTRRDRLQSASVSPDRHAGLWLDKFISDQARENTTSRHMLAAEVEGCAEPALYRAFYGRWQEALVALSAERRMATMQGRMIVGLGNESVLEASVALHRTYGVPVIPGSALKGLAATYARTRLDEQWNETSVAYKTVFGTTAEAGYITFFDALYEPGSGKQGRALYADVLTVHHKAYYQAGNDPPADWDSPTPVPFISATGRYLIALHGPGAWIQATFDILGAALLELGVGAKTSSGYGRLTLEGYVPAAASHMT